MPVLEDLKKEVEGYRAEVRETKTAYEVKFADLVKKHGEENALQSTALKTLTEKYEAKAKEFDQAMNEVFREGKLPGSSLEDKKGNEVAAGLLKKFFRGDLGKVSADEKALLIEDGPNGGVLVPPQRSNRIVEKVIQISPVRQLATVMPSGGDYLEFVKETGDLEASWSGEVSIRSEDTSTKFGLERIPVNIQTALVRASRNMLADSAIDLESYLGAKAARKFGKSEGIAFLTGSGVGRPQGILTSAAGLGTTTSTTAASAQFAPDDVLDCEASLISDYAANGMWMMHRLTANFIRKFKTTQNEYLKMIELAALKMLETGQRQLMLDGYPLMEGPDMTQMASSAKVGIFADWKELYTIVDREGMTIIRDIYSAKNNGIVEFLFERRLGGQVVQSDAGKILVCKA